MKKLKNIIGCRLLLYKSRVCTIFRTRVIRQNVPHKFTELCMETPCWCPCSWAPTRVVISAPLDIFTSLSCCIHNERICLAFALNPLDIFTSLSCCIHNERICLAFALNPLDIFTSLSCCIHNERICLAFALNEQTSLSCKLEPWSRNASRDHKNHTTTVLFDKNLMSKTPKCTMRERMLTILLTSVPLQKYNSVNIPENVIRGLGI